MAHIQLYYPKRLAFGPADFEDPGLGGTESSIVLLAKAFAKRGHHVEVFCACWKPGIYDGVSWRGAWEIYDAILPDVLIHVRTKNSVIDKQAGTHIFWMLDDRVDGAIHFNELFSKSQVVLASDVMIERLNKADFTGNITKIHLPIEIERYINNILPSTSKICLHTSMPNRGLVELLKIWPQIYKQVSDARLFVTSGWELWGYTEEEATDRMKQTLGSEYCSDGIIFTGVLSRQKLINLIKCSRLGIFPSYFPEMYCLSAAELCVAGKPLIASDFYALSERVIDGVTGYCISGDIRDEMTHMAFIERTVELLRNDVLVDTMGLAAKERYNKSACDYVASQWEMLF